MEHRERSLRGWLLSNVRGVEDRRRELSRTSEKLGALLLAELNEERAEEVAPAHERERALELRATRRENAGSSRLRAPTSLVDQRRLADSRRALDREEHADSRHTPDEAVDGGELRVALQELE